MLIFLLLLLFNIVTPSKIRGVNLGSYFVLEPYINPSLFYQFIGLNDHVISDSYMFCKYLGPYEANKQLIEHWNNWINFEKLDKLKNFGINTIRIPVADWMFSPYEVFDINQNNVKCYDKSIYYLDKLFDYCDKLNLNILLDLHAMKDSQNGFDNSGLAKNIEINKKNNIIYFDHWHHRSADWIGDYDLNTKKYLNVNYDNINYSLNVIKIILKKYGKRKSFWGFEPINEPWEFTPLPELKTFYKNVYDIFTKEVDNHKVLIFHDSFRPDEWTNAFFLENDGKPKVKIYLDTHQYMAWGKPIPFNDYIKGAKKWKQPYSVFDIIVGEFSLATDNCIMWLNGFMDNYPGFPLQECYLEDCPHKDKYLPQINKVVNGPFGSGYSFPTKDGECPTTIPIYLNKNITLENEWIEKSKNYNIADREKYYAKKLFEQLTNSFEKNSSGWIFWNFDVESSTYQWSFINLIDKGYIKPLNTYEYTDNTYQLYILFFCIILIILFILLFNITKIPILPSYQQLLYTDFNYYRVIYPNDNLTSNEDTQIEQNDSEINYGAINA